MLFLTGIVQKYRNEPWSQKILSTPDRLELIQNIHHIAAIILTLEVLYHLGRGIYLLARRKMSHGHLPGLAGRQRRRGHDQVSAVPDEEDAQVWQVQL